MRRIQFMKNVAMSGGFIFVAAFGPGAYALARAGRRTPAYFVKVRLREGAGSNDATLAAKAATATIPCRVGDRKEDEMGTTTKIQRAEGSASRGAG